MTTVVNVKFEQCDLSIMRPGRWGNPFVVGRDGTAEECVQKYREWLPTRPELMADVLELQGMRLGCSCKPGPCHGDVLVEVIEGVEPGPFAGPGAEDARPAGRWGPGWVVLPGGSAIWAADIGPCGQCGRDMEVYRCEKDGAIRVSNGCPACLKRPAGSVSIGRLDPATRSLVAFEHQGNAPGRTAPGRSSIGVRSPRPGGANRRPPA